MKLKLILYLIVSAASFAAAQIPCGPTITPPVAISVNWPQFNFDAAHTACNPYESVLSPATVGNLTLDWQYATQGGGSPVVANGVVYIPDSTGILYALNASTGTYLWSYQPDHGGSFGPAAAVANGAVYIGYKGGPLTSGLYAFDARTGLPLWKYDGVGAVSPTVANGVVYVASSSIIALDAGTGQPIWTYDAGGVLTQPVVANGMVYSGSSNGNIYAVSASTGALVWQLQTGNPAWVGPVANNVVYASSSGSPQNSLYALNASTGALIWKAPGLARAGALARGVLYLGTGYPDDAVYALNDSTGAVIWEFALGNLYVTSSLAVADGVLYFSVGGQSTDFYAVDANTGAYLWDSPNLTTSSPAVANGKVYVGVAGGVAAFHLPGQ